MGNIISDTQAAFIKGRLILDGVLIANEVIEFIHRKKKKVRNLVQEEINSDNKGKEAELWSGMKW